MTFIKLIFLFILITMMEHHGIIYRTGRRTGSEKEIEGTSGKIQAGRSIMEGTWRLVGVNKEQSILIFPYEEPAVERNEQEKKDLLISFFPDSTFTQIDIRGRYLNGRWAYDSLGQSVLMTLGRKTEEIPLSFDKAANGLKLMSFEFSSLQVLSFIETGKPISRYQDDPFYSVNNRWRVKPKQPESKELLTMRLMNYVLHSAYVLKAAQIREQKGISLEFSDGIIRLYNVGIGIVKPDKIPQMWIDGFYSREDAIKAYYMFEDYLLSKDHKKSQTGNWVRDDYNILIDIHNGLAKRRGDRRP